MRRFESSRPSHAVRSPPSPCTGRAASHGPAPWLPGRRERRVEARAGALHNEHVDAVVSSIGAGPRHFTDVAWSLCAEFDEGCAVPASCLRGVLFGASFSMGRPQTYNPLRN
jgi:hypothetical protein